MLSPSFLGIPVTPGAHQVEVRYRPGAWTTVNGTKLQLFDSRKELVRTFGAVKGKIGEVVEVKDGRLVITAQGGRIHAGKAKLGDGKKLAAAEAGIKAGTILGT